MINSFKEDYCKVCEDCSKIDEDKYACFCEPCKGKCIDEIEECPNWMEILLKELEGEE